MSKPASVQPVNLQATRVLALLEQHEQSEAKSAAIAVQLGRELAALKASMPHGAWLKWLKSEWPRSIRRAQQYMEVADIDAGELQVDTLDQLVEVSREKRRQERIATERAIRIVTPSDAEGRWTAEVGDARKLPLDDGVAGIVIFSPPYNARLKYEGYEDWLPWDEWWEGLIIPSLQEAARVLKPGGRLCLNLANVVRDDVGNSDGRWRDDYTPGSKRAMLRFRSRGGKKWQPAGRNGGSWAKLLARHVWQAIEDVGLLERENLTWIKSNDPEGVVTTSTAWGSFGEPSNPVLRAVAEPIYIADRDTHTYKRPPGAKSDLTPDEFKAWTRNAWFIPNEGGTVSRWGKHPAPFPEELPRRLMKLYSYPGDLVVDSFMGLAATGAAALKTSRRFYGCDVSPAYVERARARLEAVAKGGRA